MVAGRCWQVFTTCGSAAKRAFLRATFPWLDDAHIGNSRSTAFEATVLQGVHSYLMLAFCCLAVDLVRTSQSVPLSVLQLVPCARLKYMQAGDCLSKRPFSLSNGSPSTACDGDMLRMQTGGQGVHLALNSLADDKLQVRRRAHSICSTPKPCHCLAISILLCMSTFGKSLEGHAAREGMVQ